ncbi:MAG: putative metal-binding motif-containing protein [Sandaracinaceae bacterium]|nr:putative metal-binding motif-containing protein [Sandaracinaceae bacterium]
MPVASACGSIVAGVSMHIRQVSESVTGRNRCLVFFFAVSACAGALGCGGGNSGSNDAGSVAVCETDGVCDDGRYCTGVERCLPSDARADARGCVTGGAPCTGADICNEDTRMCTCSGTRDNDSDGADSIACGGDDCDDGDARRFPGAAEVCDAEGVDEDCDPTTLGPDMDNDGDILEGCCNLQSSGTLLCGTDCDDQNPNVAPGAPEICDGLDNNCSGSLSFPGEDDDDDGYADCMDLPVALRDCDDQVPTVYPGAPELCDGRDNDCNGVLPPGDDRDGDGFAAMGAECTAGVPQTDCDDFTPFVSPAFIREACDGRDNDCDSRIDEECSGHCDPVTDGTIVDSVFLSETLDGCASACADQSDTCMQACVQAAYAGAVSTQCAVCAEVLYGGLLGNDDCLTDPTSGECLCGSDLLRCTGIVAPGCTTPSCGHAYFRYPYCADTTCSDAACVPMCAAPTESWCKDCVSELQACELLSCAAACADHGAFECDACLQTNCVPAFDACSGSEPLAARTPDCTAAEASALQSPTGPPIEDCLDGCFDTCGLSDLDCLRMCGGACADAATAVPVSEACVIGYASFVLCRRDVVRSTGACAAACASPGAACDACRCDECEQRFFLYSGFTSGACHTGG